MPWIIACQRRPNISATAPANSGDTPIHKKPISPENSNVDSGVAADEKNQASTNEREMYSVPSSPVFDQRSPAQPKKRLPRMLKPPIMPSAFALSIGSMPHSSRYDGRCVVRNTNCIPHTKNATVITMNGR